MKRVNMERIAIWRGWRERFLMIMALHIMMTFSIWSMIMGFGSLDTLGLLKGAGLKWSRFGVVTS
jgi:hypothetical protein